MHWSTIGHRLIVRTLPLLMSAILLAFGCTPAPRPVTPAAAPPPDLAQLWSEPADIAARDLFHGPGGPDLEPVPNSIFTFIAKDDSGFSPGYDVRDIPGTKWSVKYGPEAQSEVVASRIVWALGYHQPPIYHVAQLASHRRRHPSRCGSGRALPARAAGVAAQGKLVLGPESVRGDAAVSRPHRTDARPEQLGPPRREHRPLRSRRARPRARTVYVVRDLGAALGRTKRPPTSSVRNDIESFERQGFIKGVTKDGYVRLDDTHWRHEKLYDAITPEDVRWTCDRLRRLSPRQWADAFRAARYDPALADRFIRRLQEKVQMGSVLKGRDPAERTARAGRP